MTTCPICNEAIVVNQRDDGGWVSECRCGRRISGNHGQKQARANHSRWLRSVLEGKADPTDEMPDAVLEIAAESIAARIAKYPTNCAGEGEALEALYRLNHKRKDPEKKLGSVCFGRHPYDHDRGPLPCEIKSRMEKELGT